MLLGDPRWRPEFRRAPGASSLPIRIPSDASTPSDRAGTRNERDLAQAAGLVGCAVRKRVLIRAKGSGHMIHLGRPDLVITAVLDVVRESRTGKE